MPTYHYLIPAVISSVLAGLASQIPQLAALMWIALVPFFYGLYKSQISLWRSWLYCFTFGFLFYLWFFSIFWSIAPFTWPGLGAIPGFFLRLLSLLVICMIQAFWLGWLSLLASLSKKMVILPSLAAACLWVVLESCQSLTSYNFSGTRLALSQFTLPIMFQGASLFGTLIISSLLVFSNSLLAESWLYHHLGRSIITKRFYLFLNKADEHILAQLNRHPNQSYGFICFALALLLIVLNGLSGFISLSLQIPASTSFKQIVVSDNTPIQAVNQEKADLIIWPATEITADWSLNSVLNKALAASSQTTDAYILSEVYHQAYNNLILIPPQTQESTDIKVYPQTEITDILKQKTSETLLPLSWGTLASLSNIEIFFPNRIQNYVSAGAENLIIMNRSAWADYSYLKPRLLSQAVFRAVENRRFVTYAYGKDASVFINPKGQIIKTENIDSQTFNYLTVTVPLYNQQTFYNQFGDLPMIAVCTGILVIIYLRYRLINY